MTVRMSSQDAEQRIKRVRSARGRDRSNFCALVERAGLDPSRDLRYGNFSGVDFSGCDLRGYNFTGAALHGCAFKGARISGAKFAQSEFSYSMPVAGRTDQRNDNPAVADDWTDAYRWSTASDLRLPQTFDRHIQIGQYFRDFEFSPLMRCVVLRQPDGMGIKMAVAVSDAEVNRSRNIWKEHAPDDRTSLELYVEALNTILGLGDHFAYRIAASRRKLIERHDPRSSLGNIDVEFETVDGLAFIAVGPKLPPSTFNEYRAFAKRDISDSDSLTVGVPVYAGKIMRRMRDVNCERPPDFDDRTQQ